MDYPRGPFMFAFVAALLIMILSPHLQASYAQPPRLACPCENRKACSCPEVNIQQLIRRIAALSGNEAVNRTLLAALQLLNNGTLVPNKCSQDEDGRGNVCVVDFQELIPGIPQFVSCECPQSCPGRCDGNSTYSCSSD